MTKPWMLDELAHAGPEHLDPVFVAGYERKQGYPDPAEDLAVLATHGLDETSTVVDLGAGTGRFALTAARRFGQVTAVDISGAMLGFLRRRAAAAAVANLACVQAGFLSYQHAGPPADAVYTRNALHQLPDFWKAVALTASAQCYGPAVCFAYTISSMTSSRPRPTRCSSGGSTTPPTIRPGDTPARTSPSTSAPSTAPSAGCWNRCSLPPASRS
jgi:SAM-dependent methyltransferase